MKVTLANGSSVVETGCWVDGHWGIYAIDHMMVQCAGLVGFNADDYPAAEADQGGEDDGVRMEVRMEYADKLEDALNAVTPDGFLWHWHDGEFFLSPFCGGTDDCTDDTCACSY